MGSSTGNNTDGANPTPTQVGTDLYTQVAANNYHSLALKADGSLWAWGYNSRGQLGTTNMGVYVANPTPIRVGTDLYSQVAAGPLHCLGLRADGSLWAWGGNYNGQLGTTTNSGTNASNPTPTRIGSALYSQVAAGGAHTLALRADGTLWAWGDNSFGQLGINNRQVTNPTPTQLGTDLYKQVAAGDGHSLGLRATGSLYAWGSNYSGQLGNTTNVGIYINNPTPRQVGTDLYTQVAVGGTHSLGLRANGSLWTWGSNYESELGQGTLDGYAATPAQEATGSTNWASLSSCSASSSSVIRTASGLTFASAGRNTLGQLGDGTTTNATRFDRLRPLGTSQPLPVLATGPASSGLNLYPNPAPGRATLRGATPGASVFVLDALGRPVLRATADAAGTARFSGLPTGLYLVRSDSRTLRLAVE